ncbi:MAG TPA: DUF4214 domain-containing protein, partial [Thermomicrobiales bacterium]|nr:DUF4214 domain-containing protein [Thermomicrobiales bacterium]
SQVAADWTAMIDWGDGTTTAGTITGGSGGFTISGAHTYADEGAFTILASFADDAPSTLSATITSAAQVAEADAFTALPAPIVLTGSENASVLGNVAIFSDPGYPNNIPSDLSATIDWGDGTTGTGTITTAGDGNFTVGGSHTYAQDGAYTITTSISDDSPSTASATATATAKIAEADWTLSSAISNLTATEGAAVSGVVATLSDPGADPAGNFAATIDWGDGTTTTGVVSGASGSYSISGSHTYAEEGAFAVQVSVVEASAAPAATISSTGTLTVADAPLSAISAAMAGAEGATIAAVVAQFTDADPNGAAADFSATIDWGDGATSAGTIASNGAGGFNVSGAHAYAEDGAYAVKVTIADQGGATAVANSSANITEPAISATAVAVSGFERSPLAVPVATFQLGNGAEPAGKFAATIDWGDGTSSTGTVSQPGAVYTVSGTHVYLDEGVFPISVHISDDSASTTATTAATIAEELLSNGTVGTPTERFVQEVYRDLLHRAVDPSALLYWSNMLDQGQSRLQVVKNIIDVASRGELGGDVVTGIFEKYLGRAPDAAGLAYWVGVYQNTPIEQIESEIAATPEFFALAGGTNSGFITRLFNLALGRNPEPAALDGFNAAFQTGVTRELAAEAVFGSHEFHQDEIQGYYLSSSDGNDRFAATTPYLDDLDFLDRSADAGGLAAFTDELDHSAADQQIWAKMMASDEFYAKVAWLAQPLK